MRGGEGGSISSSVSDLESRDTTASVIPNEIVERTTRKALLEN